MNTLNAEERMAQLIEYLTLRVSAHRAEEIIKALPESFEVDNYGACDAFVPAREELVAAAQAIETDWGKRFAPLPDFLDLDLPERARWHRYAARNCAHLPRIPEDNGEALYLEYHGETPSFIVDQDERAKPKEDDYITRFPRFKQGDTPYVEEYFSITTLPMTRLQDMSARPIEFPIPREVRVYEHGAVVTLRQGRAWPMHAILIDGAVRSLKELDVQAWAQGKEASGWHRPHLEDLPNRLLLVEVWEDRGDDGHMGFELGGFAVMTQMEFAEYLAHLSNMRYRRSEKSEAQKIREKFAPQ